MSHFTRELDDAAWYLGRSVPAIVFRNIDEKTKKAISETGGTYAPTTPIIIGGAGLELQSGVLFAGGATIAPGAGKNYYFGDGDYFRHTGGHLRTIDDSPLAILKNHTLQREARAWMAVSNGTTPAIQTKRAGARLTLPIRLPDGARLQQVRISFKVGQTHTNPPQKLPLARVIRISKDGVAEPHPNLTSLTREPGGWVSAGNPGGTGASWYGGGAMQLLDLDFDSGSGPRADRSLFDYAVQWREESGTDSFTGGVGNYLLHLRVTSVAPDLRPF